ncbi:MAG: response regulator [Anaerolineae bacterium]|nr:response regulator [Anaerolineae bacterium]
MDRNETVLVIDDRPENLETLTKNILEPAGYTVMSVTDGNQGLQMALQNPPDLIVMDVRAPRLGGIEFLQELRKAGRDVPVILTAFHGSDQAAIQAFKLGVRDYILKPYEPREMHSAVERALAEQRLQRERDRLAESVASLNRKMERQVKELSVLFGIGKSVTSLLDQDRVLTRIVEAAVYITRAEEGFLLLVDEQSGELYMRAARGFGEKYARGFRLKVDDSLAGEVVRSGKPLIIAASSRDSTVKVKTGYLVKSILHVPIKVGNVVIGVLSVDHMIEDLSFDDHDLYVLSVIADYAAIALENARLYNRLQQRLSELSDETPLPEPVSAVPAATRVIAAPETVEKLAATLQQGREHLTSLQEQVSLFETWIELLQVEHKSLADLSATQVTASVSADMSEPRLDDLLNSMDDGVLIIGPEERVVIANRAAEEILGGKLIDQPVETVCGDPRWSKTYRIVQRALQLELDAPGADIAGATTALNITGQIFRATFRPLIARQRPADSFIAVLRNVDAEQRAQRAKDSFIASVSQELRTPVTSILTYTELLFDASIGPLNSTQNKLLGRIRVNSEQMTTLLEHLVEMTFTDSSQLSLVTETTDLTNTIRQAATNLEAQTQERHQALSLDLAADLPAVQAHEDAVYHIITNLLRNALLCSPQGAEIVLNAQRMQENREQYVTVSITDRGGGIAPQDQKRIFNRYYRSDHPNIAGLAAPDVGLYIVKMLVEAQGGRIWLDSRPGIGSTFTFVLPAYTRYDENG